MKAYKTEDLRNIGLFSHGGTGKTSLSEAMLFDAGAVNRLGRVEEGTTISDYDADETKRHISVQLSLLPFEWKGHKVNVIDTPGYADFVGERREGIRVVDGAIVLVDAVGGVEVGTEQVWGYADEYDLPRVLFVNRIDRENADFSRTVDQLRAKFGTRVVPIQLPIGSQQNFRGVIDLVRMKACTGPKLDKEEPIPADLVAQADQAREKLVEAAAETDDTLLNKYLEGEELSADEIRKGLRGGVVNGKIVPVLVGSATANWAVVGLMDAVVDYLPSPVDRGEVVVTNVQANKEEKLAPSDTAPLVAHYAPFGNLHRVPGMGTIDGIAQEIKRVVGR